MRRIALTALVATLVGPAACHSSRRPASAPAVTAAVSPVDLALDHLPAGSRAFFGFDFAKLDAAPLGQRMFDTFGRALGSSNPSLSTNCAFETRELGLMVGGGPFGANSKDAAAIMRTTLSEQVLVACMKGMVSGKGADIVRETVAGRPAYHADARAPTDNAWLAALAPGHFAVAGNRGWLEKMLDVTAPKARQNAAVLVPMFASVDTTAPLWFAIALEPDERQAIVAFMKGQLTSAPVSIGISVLLSDTMTTTIHMAFENEAAATSGKQVATMVLERFRAQLAGGELEKVLEDVTITTEAAAVSIVVRLGAADLETLIKVLGPLVTIKPNL